MLFMFSPVTSRLSERYGVRQVILLGGILMSVGLLLTSFAADILFMYLTYGILLGIGTSLCATMALIVTADYFEKHLSLATGIAASGGSIGTLALAPTLQVLVDSYGWRVTFRIMAIGGFVLALTGLIYEPRSRGRIVLEDPWGASTQKPRHLPLFDLSVLKNHAFVIWIAALTTAGVGYYLPHFFLVIIFLFYLFLLLNVRFYTPKIPFLCVRCNIHLFSPFIHSFIPTLIDWLIN